MALLDLGFHIPFGLMMHASRARNDEFCSLLRMMSRLGESMTRSSVGSSSLTQARSIRKRTLTEVWVAGDQKTDER